MQIELDQKYLLKRIKPARSCCGLYVKNCDMVKQYPGELIAVPLKHIDYDIEIFNNLSKISLKQEYINPLSTYLELQYSFPINPDACLNKFRAKFGNVEIEGVVKEKQEAKKQYQQKKSQGIQVAYGQIDSFSKDIMNLKIGNVPPLTSVTITLEIIQQLQVTMNTFWCLNIFSTISPRYMDNPNEYNQVIDIKRNVKQQKVINKNKIDNKYTWSFKINLKTSKPCIYMNSKTHQLLQISTNQNRTESIFVMEQACVPNKDFSFVYTTQNFQLPTYVLGTTDLSKTAMVSFIPKFCDMKVDDAYSAYVSNKKFEVDMNCARGEYIFLLDRSGSMQGKRIQKAKQALIFFLRSLPQDSYFNVFSFGDSCLQLFRNGKGSMKYSNNSLKLALDEIKSYSANLGGTVIYTPLQKIFQRQVIRGYPRQIFLLTDGAVSNTQKVLKLVKQNIKFSRVHTIGIGNGASEALIKGCAENGKGKHVFLFDDENVSGKIIQLLDQVMTPIITDFQLKYDQEIFECVVPNPKDMPFIMKNQSVSTYMIFKTGFEGTAQISLVYKDSLNAVYEKSLTISTNDVSNFPFVDKMAHHKTISTFAEAADNSMMKVNNYLAYRYVKDVKQLAISESIKYQILCKLTAFICVGKQLVDGKYHEYKNKELQKIHIFPQKPIEKQMLKMKTASISHPISAVKKSSGVNLKKQSVYDSAIKAPLFCIPVQKNHSKNEVLMRSSKFTQKNSKQIQISQSRTQMRIAKEIEIEEDEDEEKFNLNLQPERKESQKNMKKQRKKQANQQNSKLLDQKKSEKGKQQKKIAHKNKAIKFQLEDLLSAQMVDGSWDVQFQKQILQLIQLSQQKMIKLKALYATEILMTLLVIDWLEKYHNVAQFTLIIRKAKKYVQKNFKGSLKEFNQLMSN